MKKLLKKKKLIALLLLVLIAMVWAWKKYTNVPSPNEPSAIWVEATKAKEVSLPLEAKAMGTLVGRSVDISPEISGHVEKILFTDGSFVKKGTVLIQLDDAVYRAKYHSAVAQLTYIANNFKRLSLLEKKGIIARQAIDQAEADLKEKKANAQENEVMVNKMKLTAPFDGMLGKAKVHPGNYVTTGQSVVRLTDTKHLRVEYNIPEKYLPLIKIGQTVTVTTPSYPDKKFLAKLTFISPTITSDNRSISLYADIPNEDNLLTAGMLVDVIHSLGQEKNVLMVPARSLVPILEGEQIFTVVNGKAYANKVTTGKRTEENVQILRGLSPDALIITDGQHKIRNGSPVKVKT